MEDIQFSLESTTLEPPIFTLTCNISGGPVINVNWTQNGIEKPTAFPLLMDRVRAEYRSNLTVQGRSYGTYTCTAYNNLLMISRNLIIQGNIYIYIHIYSLICML